jgi:peptide/nickel transport system permease protein
LFRRSPVIFREKFRGSTRLLVGSAITAAVLLVSLFTPWIAPHGFAAMDLTNQLAPPGREYLLGTDFMGRCLLSRLLYGLRLSVFLASVILLLRVSIGVTLGLISGYCGGLPDQLISRLVDFVLALPDIVLALVIVGMLGPGIPNLILALSVLGWAKYTRIIRSTVVSLKEKQFVESARAIGSGSFYIMWRHILPNSIPPVIPLVTLGLGSMIIHIGGLSFIGLGVEPGTPELGMLIQGGFSVFPNQPHLVLLPSLLIIITVLGFTLLGDGLRDTLDPRKNQLSMEDLR